jgi:hypothetical protein
MAFVVLFVLSFIAAFALRWIGCLRKMSVLTPPAAFITYILFHAYVLPYRGGGASMWPIAILFGAPVACLGALAGTAASGSLRRSRAS